MEATCCYFGEADYTLDPCTTTTPRARKEHQCCECLRVIVPGEVYERVRGAVEGRWEEHKTCLGCQRLRDDVACEGYVFEALRETIRGCMGVDIATGEVDDDADCERCGREMYDCVCDAKEGDNGRG